MDETRNAPIAWRHMAIPFATILGCALLSVAFMSWAEGRVSSRVGFYTLGPALILSLSTGWLFVLTRSLSRIQSQNRAVLASADAVALIFVLPVVTSLWWFYLTFDPTIRIVGSFWSWPAPLQLVIVDFLPFMLAIEWLAVRHAWSLRQRFGRAGALLAQTALIFLCIGAPIILWAGEADCHGTRCSGNFSRPIPENSAR